MSEKCVLCCCGPLVVCGIAVEIGMELDWAMRLTNRWIFRASNGVLGRGGIWVLLVLNMDRTGPTHPSC